MLIETILLGVLTLQTIASAKESINFIQDVDMDRREKSRQVLILPPDYSDDLEVEDVSSLADRLSAKDLNCVLDKDTFCSKKMLAIKETLKKAILEDCGSCSDAEKEAAGPVMTSLVLWHPREWRRLFARISKGRKRRDFGVEESAGSFYPDSIPLSTKPIFYAYYELLVEG